MRRRRRIGVGLWYLMAAALFFVLVAEQMHSSRLHKAVDPLPAYNTLAEWNNEMIRAYGRGDMKTSAAIAGKILSQPEWRAYIPANAVMGSVLAHEGKYAAAEPFFKIALSGRGLAAPQPAVMREYANTLRHLGRNDEAAELERRALVNEEEKT